MTSDLYLHLKASCAYCITLVGLLVVIYFINSTFGLSNIVNGTLNYLMKFNRFNFTYILLFAGVIGCVVILWFYSTNFVFDLMVWFGFYKFSMFLYHGSGNSVQA